MREETISQIFDLCASLGTSGAGWFDSTSVTEVHRPIGFRFFKHSINIDAQLGTRKLTTTGEADSLELAQTKAAAELIERWALLSSPKAKQSETSNGWAAHSDKEQAKQNAVFELVERDAVLSQWYSSTPFFQISNNELPARFQQWIAEELSHSEFPELVVLISTTGIGPSVTCILKNQKSFGVSGHATRQTLEESISSAIAEACRAAHSTLRREYWGDTLKLKDGNPGSISPGAHSVYYAYHEPFPLWMFGPKLSWSLLNAQWLVWIESVIKQSDEFKFQTVLESPVFVGFAKHPLAFDLRWGSTFVEDVLRSAGAKRLGLSSINRETHIVS